MGPAVSMASCAVSHISPSVTFPETLQCGQPQKNNGGSRMVRTRRPQALPPGGHPTVLTWGARAQLAHAGHSKGWVSSPAESWCGHSP